MTTTTTQRNKTGSFEFTSIDKSSSPSTGISGDADKKRSRLIPQPPGTISYIVETRDTIEKLALRFNMTPSELLHLNKLISRTIFPGQALFVPDLNKKSDDETFIEPVTNVIQENRRPQSPESPRIPGRAHRLRTDSSLESLSSEKLSNNKMPDETFDDNSTRDDDSSSEDELSGGFLKLRANFVTEDHQLVSGTLLITPSAILFDSDIQEPLIDGHHLSNRTLLIRIDRLAHIVAYDDIAFYDYRTCLREGKRRRMLHSNSIKTRYHMKIKENHHDKLWSTNFPGKTSNLSELELLFDIGWTQTTVYIDELIALGFNDFDEIIDNHKGAIEILSDERNFSGFDFIKFRRAVKESNNNQFYVSFSSLNKADKTETLHNLENHYHRVHPVEIPLYLRLKTSTHTPSMPSLQPMKKRTADKSLDSVKQEEEFWFSVPREKKDFLSKFFLRWVPPETFQATTSESKQSSDGMCTSGFVLLVNEDPELDVDHSPFNIFEEISEKHDHFLKNRKSLIKDWEIVSVDEIYRRFTRETAPGSSFDPRGIPGPNLLQKSSLIDDEKATKLLVELPPRIQELNWFLEFSTEINGFSLNQLYRRSFERERDDPSLLIIKDVEGNIFGAFVSHQLLISEGFYGNGETFLFTFSPTFRTFHWSGTNEFFVKGDLHSLGIGTGDGKYGLWIDGDLYRGRTCSTKTFQNDPLTMKEDFTIADVELWTFVD